MLSLFYQLPNCNLFTQHVLFILWRDTTSELWIPVLFPSYCYHLFTLLALFTLLTYYYCFPLDTLIPFVSSKPVRLTTSSQVGNEVLGCVVCRFRVAASKQSLDEAPYINCPKLSQASKHHLQSFVSPLQERLNLGFLTKGKPAAILITPSPWGSQRAGHSPRTRTAKLPHQLGASLRRQNYCILPLYLLIGGIEMGCLIVLSRIPSGSARVLTMMSL
jgi:hypothetical protein